MEPMDPIGDEVSLEPERRLRGGCSTGRVANLCMAFVFLLILVTAIIVIGLIGYVDSSIRVNDLNPGCPLFITPEGNRYRFSSDSVCYFVLTAFGVIGLVALVYLVVQVVFVIFQFKLWITVLVDLIVMALLALCCFASAVTISAGLGTTCKTLVAQSESHRCDMSVYYEGRQPVLFYGSVYAAQGAAWVCLFLIAVMLIVAVIRVSIYVRRKRSKSTEMENSLISDNNTNKS